MLLAVGLLMLCQCVCFIGIYWLITRWAERKQREIERRIDAVIRDWTSPGGEGKPSRFAQLVYTMGETVGQAAARSLQSTLKADASHVARVANGVSDTLEAQANPLSALISGTGRGKGAAIRRLGELILPMLAGGGHGGDNDNGRSSVVGRLGRQ